MCSATVGATPVWRWTCAASAIFSYGSRGTPACANTLNRVPELPNAQDGTSTVCARKARRTASWLVINSPVGVRRASSWRATGGSALHRARRQPRDDLAVEEDEEDQWRDGDEH